MLMAAGVAAAALAGRALLRQARGGAGMGSVFQQFTGASSVGGAMKVRVHAHLLARVCLRIKRVRWRETIANNPALHFQGHIPSAPPT